MAQWRKEFDKLERCPWPGPRPLTLHDDDAHLLCGRDDDMDRFLNEVDSYQVIFLTGSSGVGKTSFLQAGLVPKLEERGYLIAVCRDWSGAAEDGDPAGFLSRRVARALKDRVPGLPEDLSVMRELSTNYGEKAVLVLDQFEELIRDARGFSQKLFEALGSINHHSDIKIIISLRSEHLHELRPFEHKLKPYSTTYFYLEPVGNEYIGDVILAGNLKSQDRFGREAIEPSAAQEVTSIWDAATQVEVSSSSELPGLLGLQALLHVLDERADGVTVTSATLDRLKAQLGLDGTSPAESAQLFSRALSESAAIKLRRCGEASMRTNVDPYLVEGVMGVLSRSVQHLTSGGYKLVRNVWDLAQLALADEIVTLERGMKASRNSSEGPGDGPIDPTQERAVFDVLLRGIFADGDDVPDADGQSQVDFLASPRSEVAFAADALAPGIHPDWVERLHPSADTYSVDPEEVTSGPFMGLAPAEVFIEEVRRFAVAMEWLDASCLVRFSMPGAGLMTVALIHDGFGTALELWAARQRELPGAALHALTASGDECRWPTSEGEYRPEFDGSELPGSGKVIANLRWKGSGIIDTAFRKVMFVNCDLRGALFLRCSFSGVSFINCLLDGLMISDCHVAGEASPRPATYAFGPTAFVIASSEEVAKTFAEYRGWDGQARALLADLPGLPAVADPGVFDDLEEITVEPGALVIRGGRTASLAVRSISFDDDASFCLRDTAGSGFDVIEHRSQGTYEITGCVLRHITFTTPPHRSVPAEPLKIRAHGSALYQAWIGDELSGEFTATDCTLLSVWNGSPEDSFVAKAGERCTYHGLIAVRPDDTCVPLSPGEMFLTVADLKSNTDRDLIGISHLMDYRRSSIDDDAVLERQRKAPR